MDLKKILADHKLWFESDGEKGERADLRGVDLSGVDLSGANLTRADLRGVNLSGVKLSGVDLCYVNLRGADLSGADMSRANLSGADMSRANLCGADMSRANLCGADLRGANIDFSCWPLWCGSQGVRVDLRIIYQLLAHVVCLNCEEKEFAKIKKAIMPYAKKSHRATDLGL